MTSSKTLLAKPAKISVAQIQNVLYKLGADGELFSQQDAWAYVVDNYGYIHNGFVNPVFNDMEHSGIIAKTGATVKSAFGKKMALYKLV